MTRDLLSIILDALNAFEDTIKSGDLHWGSYPAPTDNPEATLRTYLSDIADARKVIIALMPGPRLSPEVRKAALGLLDQIEAADNPDSVKLPADVAARLERFKQDHPDLVSVASYVTDVEDWFEHELDPFIRKHLPDPNTRPEGRMEQLRQIVGDDKEATTTTCKHCGRSITPENGTWIDPNAAGDDAVWRETCDSHDTVTAEHEPTFDQVIDEAAAAGMFEPENTVAAFNRLLDALDAARVDTDEPDGVQRYQDAREACFAFVDAHPEVLPLAREYGLPISPGELPQTDPAVNGVLVLTIDHHHGFEVSVHRSHRAAMKELFAWVDQSWSTNGPAGDIPNYTEEAIKAYFDFADETYHISPALLERKSD